MSRRDHRGRRVERASMPERRSSLPGERRSQLPSRETRAPAIDDTVPAGERWSVPGERLSALPEPRVTLAPGTLRDTLAPAPTKVEPPSRRALRALGIVGSLGSATALVAVDVVTAIHPISLAFSIIETGLILPFLALVLRQEAREAREARSKSAVARAWIAHALPIVLLVVAMAQKWITLLSGLAGEGERYASAYGSLTIVALLLVVFGVLGRGRRLAEFLAEAAEHPARLMTLSFGLATFVGGYLLSLPQAVRDVRDADLLDGLFTATSAVCVTGLAVNDIASTYTLFGQVVIALLAQIGGLGIMALSASFAVLAGRKLRVKQSAVLAEMIDASSLAALRRNLLAIVGFTLVFEVLGATLLYAAAGAHPEVALGPASEHPAAGAGSRLWWAVFHAVSAFCNAGFSLSHGGLADFAGSPSVNGTIAALIVLGGLGFPVLDELSRWSLSHLRGARPPRLSLHTRVALSVSALLAFAVALPVLILEWDGALGHLRWEERVMAALFQSISMRTAGFATVSFGAMAPATLMLTCLVMFVGASPGSTGGGVKTTTLAALYAVFRAELRGMRAPTLFDRELPDTTIRRALGVFFLSVVAVSAVTFVMLLSEADQRPIDVVFEVVSAFATCGLSTGITPEVSPIGEVALILTMFAGRIGPLTLALAIATAAERRPIALPEERIVIG